MLLLMYKEAAFAASFLFKHHSVSFKAFVPFCYSILTLFKNIVSEHLGS